MIKTVTFDDFVDSFSEPYKNNFSYEGKRALFDYLENYEESTGDQVELDPVAFCVEYQEYANAYEAMEEYQPEDTPIEGEDGDDLVEIQAKNEKAALEWLEGKTQVISFDKGIIIQKF